jgi:hypothetical protein
MTATVTGRGTATGRPAPPGRAAARRRLTLPRASTTPGKVRLIRMGLVLACLGWGALAAFMVGQHASAADDVVSVSEPLSLDAQQMYQSLADADVTASTGYLYGRIQPFPGRQRYQHDIAVATRDLKAVTAASHDSAVSDSLTTLSAELPVYTGYVEDGGAETRLVIGSGPGTAGTLFGRLEADLDAAIRVGQATFADSAAAGSSAFTGLEAGVVVLALIMATGSAWGLSRRLAEYR